MKKQDAVRERRIQLEHELQKVWEEITNLTDGTGTSTKKVLLLNQERDLKIRLEVLEWVLR